MKVVFYTSGSGRSPLEKFISGLSKLDQARFAEVKVGIEKHGFNYARAEFKPLKGKLWEVKFRAQDGSYRIAYVVAVPDMMVWLHAFKKDGQKTPQEHLELALKRMKEVLS